MKVTLLDNNKEVLYSVEVKLENLFSPIIFPIHKGAPIITGYLLIDNEIIPLKARTAISEGMSYQLILNL